MKNLQIDAEGCFCGGIGGIVRAVPDGHHAAVADVVTTC